MATLKFEHSIFPGAEPECDRCHYQLRVSGDETLWCDRYKVTLLHFYPNCMRENERDREERLF